VQGLDVDEARKQRLREHTGERQGMNNHPEGDSDTALRCDGVQGLAADGEKKQRVRRVKTTRSV
jgi:hypothetical protein